jgi:subtilisin
MSYRVFGAKGDGASNFAIAKAIDAAVADGCDVLNMSLGGGNPDPLTQDAIAAARAAGTIVLAANGNDNRAPVSFPASDDLCLAISAMGRKGTFPNGSEPAGSVAAPYGQDKNDFLAEFSNIGPDTDLTAPGVGVISSVPAGYGVMSGTSMACPAASGAVARLLARSAQILSMPRNQARSDAMVQAAYADAKPLGFGPRFEGKGRVLP